MAEHQLICCTCGNQFTATSTGRGRPRSLCDGCAARRYKHVTSLCEGCSKTECKTIKGLCAPCMAESIRIRRRATMRKIKGNTHLPPYLGCTKHLTICECAECGNRFTYRPHSGYTIASARRYCSRLCQKRAGDRTQTRKRRAITRGATAEKVDYNAVFARDGWKCQICGCKTVRAHRGMGKPRSPVIDHITPLSKGGDHTYINVQTACHACNTKKSNGSGGQYLLFAMV